MPGMSWPMTVVLEGEEPRSVTVDQRDIAAWERQPFGCSFSVARDRALVNFLRFLAWNAMRRQGLIDKTMGWATFDDKCIEATDLQTPEEAGELPDPTKPDPSGDI
jgi:hypothetical protein